eukprot:TRINITY_DN57147_c0_g1_i1.p1 TRINITY_DN57147_c0_g1~~TRINITY_DN57147_c0_g1_i1.p1  ORF type:complete len:950 (-),score=296.56 TRINITY_DN57147_c0_g1_i1:233-3082(-)
MMDAEECRAALVDWINSVNPAADVEEFDDLADGAILAEVVQEFAPDADPTGVSGSSAAELHKCLSMYFGSRINLPSLQGRMHGSFCKPVLLLALTEAVLLAAVEGPQKERAIQAIMSLSESKQVALGAKLQQLMTNADEGDTASPTPEPSSKEEAARKRSSLADSGRDAGLLCMSETDIMQEEVSEARDRIRAEMAVLDALRRSRRMAQEQLATVNHDLSNEEMEASDKSSQLAQWHRSYGEDLRRFAEEAAFFRQEMGQESEAAVDIPARRAALEKMLKDEKRACAELQDKTSELTIEIRQASVQKEGDDTEVKQETIKSQLQQAMMEKQLIKIEQDEERQTRVAKELWDMLQLLEVKAQDSEDSVRVVKRLAEKEEECVADSVGILAFRESEMRQLLQGSDADDSSGAPPHVIERRKLITELGHLQRLHTKHQTECTTQQSRTSELERRLNGLESESARLLKTREQESEELKQREDQESALNARKDEAYAESQQLQKQQHEKEAEGKAMEKQLELAQQEQGQKHMQEESEVLHKEQLRQKLEQDQLLELLQQQQLEQQVQLDRMVAQEQEICMRVKDELLVAQEQANKDEETLASRLNELAERQRVLSTSEAASASESNADWSSRLDQATLALADAEQQHELEQKCLEMQKSHHELEKQQEHHQQEQLERLREEQQHREKERLVKKEETQLQESKLEEECNKKLHELESQQLAQERHEAVEEEDARRLHQELQELEQTRQKLDTRRSKPERASARAMIRLSLLEHMSATKTADNTPATEASTMATTEAGSQSDKPAEERSATAVLEASAIEPKKVSVAVAADRAISIFSVLKKQAQDMQLSKESEVKETELKESEAKSEANEEEKGKEEAEEADDAEKVKELRAKIVSQEKLLRQRHQRDSERRRVRDRESELMSHGLREASLRIHMLLGQHKALLENRSRLEQETK